MFSIPHQIFPGCDKNSAACSLYDLFSHPLQLIPQCVFSSIGGVDVGCIGFPRSIPRQGSVEFLSYAAKYDAHKNNSQDMWVWVEVITQEQKERFDTTYGWLARLPNKDNFHLLLTNCNLDGYELSVPFVAQRCYYDEEGVLLWPSASIARIASEAGVDSKNNLQRIENISVAGLWFRETVPKKHKRHFLQTAPDLSEYLQTVDTACFELMGGTGLRFPFKGETCISDMPFVVRGFLPFAENACMRLKGDECSRILLKEVINQSVSISHRLDTGEAFESRENDAGMTMDATAPETHQVQYSRGQGQKIFCVVGPKEFAMRFDSNYMDSISSAKNSDVASPSPSNDFVPKRCQIRMVFRETVDAFLSEGRFFRFSMYGVYLRELSKRFPFLAEKGLGVRNFIDPDEYANFRQFISGKEKAASYNKQSDEIYSATGDIPSEIFAFSPEDVDEMFKLKSDEEVKNFVKPTTDFLRKTLLSSGVRSDQIDLDDSNGIGLLSSIKEGSDMLQRATIFSEGPNYDPHAKEVFLYDKRAFDMNGEVRRIQPHYLHIPPKNEDKENSTSVEDLQKVIAFVHDLSFISSVVLLSRSTDELSTEHQSYSSVENSSIVFDSANPSMEYWVLIDREDRRGYKFETKRKKVAHSVSHEDGEQKIIADGICPEMVLWRHVDSMTGRKIFASNFCMYSSFRFGLDKFPRWGRFDYGAENWAATASGQDGVGFIWLLADPDSPTDDGARNRKNLDNMLEYFRIEAAKELVSRQKACKS